MIVCDQCGHRNEAGSRFCANCGHRLVAEGEPLPAADPPPTPPRGAAPPPGLPPQMPAPPAPPRSTEPSAASGGLPTADLPPSHPEWRMSSAGPLPDPPRRRRWIVILLAILGVCVLLCVAVFVFLSTEPGMRWANDIMTQAAEAGTPQAGQ